MHIFFMCLGLCVRLGPSSEAVGFQVLVLYNLRHSYMGMRSTTHICSYGLTQSEMFAPAYHVLDIPCQSHSCCAIAP